MGFLPVVFHSRRWLWFCEFPHIRPQSLREQVIFVCSWYLSLSRTSQLVLFLHEITYFLPVYHFNRLTLFLHSTRFYFDFSATYVGVGMICPYLINISLLVGAILSWGIMWPLIQDRKGHWYPANQSDSSLHGIQGYRVISLFRLLFWSRTMNMSRQF